jgi:hypothetical protein
MYIDSLPRIYTYIHVYTHVHECLPMYISVFGFACLLSHLLIFDGSSMEGAFCFVITATALPLQTIFDFLSLGPGVWPGSSKQRGIQAALLVYSSMQSKEVFYCTIQKAGN